MQLDLLTAMYNVVCSFQTQAEVQTCNTVLFDCSTL